jgi:RNA polymerase sigma-70 factor (ECF subfamily)
LTITAERNARGSDAAGSDDRPLVAAARDGDRAALELLLRRHHDAVHAVCRRICGNDADALDATQEALIAIVRGLPRFDGRSAFGTWVYRIATNACLDELRRRRRRPEPGLPDLERAPRQPEPGLDSTVTDRLAADRALAQLPPDFRAAVVLRDLCELDYAEIAEVLGIPPGTVRSRIARGRAVLARALGHTAGRTTAGEPATDPERRTTAP